MREKGMLMTSALMIGSIAVGCANISLAAALLTVYRVVYAKTKAPFSLALVLFALAFLAQNVLMVYSLVTMMALVPGGLDPYLLGVGTLEGSGPGRCSGPLRPRSSVPPGRKKQAFPGNPFIRRARLVGPEGGWPG